MSQTDRAGEPGRIIHEQTQDVSAEIIFDFIEGFRKSKAVFAAVELGVFDLLARGSLRADEVARRLGTHPDATERLLDTLVALKVLEKQNGQYHCTPVARTYLVQESPHSIAGYILYSNRMLYHLWGQLEAAVQEGTHRWEQVFGLKGPIFSHFFQTPESMRVFTSGMHGLGLLSSPAVVRAFDLSRFHQLVDLGGATGHLAIEACRHYPHLRAIVFDLPGVVEQALPYIRQAGLEGRIKIQAGDFFKDGLPEGDLYAMGRILHDWSYHKVCYLIRKVYEALPAGGGFLVAEKLLNEDKTGPLSALLQSLNMLVCTEGKERTCSEYRQLLAEAGFREVECKRTGAYLDAILAIK